MRPPEDISADLRRLSQEASDAADALDRKLFECRPDDIRKAVAEAVAALNLYGPHERGTSGCLYRIVQLLAPEICRILDENGASVAYRVTHPK